MLMVYSITGPDGQEYEIEGPEGATREQVISAIQARLRQQEILSRFAPRELPPVAQIPTAPPSEDVGFLRRTADIPINVAQGATMGFRLLADAFGADNPVSKSIRSVEDYLGEMTSAAAQGNMQRMSQVFAEAEGKGLGEQIKIALRAASEAPVELMSQAFGTALPTVIAALGSKVIGTGLALGRGATALQAAQAGLAAQRTGQIGAGVVTGLGVGKSAVYDAVFEEFSKIMPEDQARAAASEAQSYIGPNTDMIALSGLLGGLAAKYGIEDAIIKAMGPRLAQKVATGAARSAIGRGIATGVSEGATEFPQGFQEQVAQNLALQRIGKDVPTFDSAVAAGTLEAVAGMGAGALTGVATRPGRDDQPEEPTTPPQVAPKTQAGGVETFTPDGRITMADIEGTGVSYPRGYTPIIQTSIVGKTREQLMAEIESSPELQEEIDANATPRAKILGGLLGLQPEREVERPATQPGLGVPVGTAGQPVAAIPAPADRIETPEPERVVSGQPDTGAQPPVAIPTAPTVTETSSGTTPPQAIKAEAQGAQAVGLTPTGAEAGTTAVETTGVAQTWTEMDRAQREQMAVRAGLKQVPATEAASKPWSRLTKAQKERIAGVMQVEPALLPEVPEATADQDQMPIPSPDMPQEKASLEALEKDRRKILRAPGPNLRTALMGTLPANEVRDISPDFSMRPLQARADKAPTSLSTLVADGQLNEFLPPNMRNDSSTFDETDSVEYIKEQLRQKNHYTFDTNFALEKIGLQIAEIEAAMREHLTLRETNLLIQEAADEQRRIDEEAEVTPAQTAARTPAPAPRVAPEPELTAEEEARLEREAIQAESEEAASRLSPTTPSSLKAAEDRAKAAEKEAEQARKDAAKADEEAKKERERREIAEASVKAARDFQLGQSAEDNLSGQRDLLQQEGIGDTIEVDGVQRGRTPFDGIERPRTPLGDAAEVEVDGQMRTALNSKGQPIHPTVEGVRNFWRFFGDSKVVDAQGRPLVVYHFTTNDFSEFATGEAGAIWLSVDPQYTRPAQIGVEGGRTMPLYVRLEKPARLSFEEIQLLDRDGVERLKREGYDGAVLDDDIDSPFTEVVVFRPTQIKSATGNRGTYATEAVNILDQVDVRSVSSLGFYSALADQLGTVKTAVAPVNGWKDLLKGMVNKGQVKQEEIEWTGINDWLDLQQGRVTKEQVMEYLNNNGVQVEEVVLGEPQKSRDLQLIEDAGYRVEADEFDGPALMTSDGEYVAADDRSVPQSVRNAMDRLATDSDGAPTKYSQYTLPGGENYREVLLTLPNVATSPEADVAQARLDESSLDDAMRRGVQQQINRMRREAQAQAEYRSRHWDQPNVLAHIRLNDRTDADGNRVLFVEELQSDWQQARGSLERKLKKAKTDDERASIQKQIDALPKGPFVGNTEAWLNLALKRIITMAAEGGYDKVAFVTGEQSADRYDLSKQVTQIIWNPEDKTLVATPVAGEQRIERSGVSESDLADIIGKEAAQKLTAPEAKQPDGRHRIKGDDLKVGGEGMKAFYDKIVPNAVKGLLKKLGGGQVGVVQIEEWHDGRDEFGAARMDPGPTGAMIDQPGFTVTDTMREKVAEGVALFSRTAQGGWSIDPEEQRIERELTGKSFDDLAQWAVDSAPDAYAKEIAQKVQKRLREFAKAGVKMNFVLESGKTRSSSMFGARGKVRRTIDKNKPAEITLSLNGAASIENQNGYPPGMRYSTILHELIHAATELYIATSPSALPVKSLNDLRNKVVKHFNDKVQAGTLTAFEKSIYDRSINALQNPDEMLAWGLTDRDMQIMLADVKVDDRSLFDRFVDIVRNILGLDRPYRSALEELIRTADSLLDVSTTEIAKGVTERGYMFGPSSGPTLSPVAAPMSQGELFQQEQTIEERAQRENVFGNGTISTWTYPTEVKIIGNTNRDDVIYSLQDKQVDTKRVIEAIRAAGKEIGTKWDAYLQETLYHGRTATDTKDFLNNELEPALEEMRKRGITKEQIGEYLHNRHAPEANAVIASRNPKFPDGGSGIKTADAQRYMRDLDPKIKADLEAVAAKIDAISQGTRDLIVRSKMESPETIEYWEEMYQHYIPLNRADADFNVSKGMTQGAGYSVAGATTKGRTGSAREVVHGEILANIAMQRELAIVRANKNRVAQAVFGLALQNPNTEFWLTLDPSTNPIWQSQETQDALDVMNEVVEGGDLSPDELKQYELEIGRLERKLEKQRKAALKAMDKLKDDFADLGLDAALINNIMQPPLKPRYDAKNNKVVYESRGSISNPHVFSARINGTDRYVLFNANNPRSKRMAEALKNMDADQLGTAMSMIAKVTRYFAAINTQYNPVFGAYNFLRDVQAALLQISTTPIADKRKEVTAGTGPAMAAIYRSTRAVTKKRKGPEGEWDALWQEFRKEGGQTGFRDMFSQSAERAAALQSMLDPSSWAESPLGKFFTAGGALKVPFETMRKGAKPVFDWLSDYNETMENAVRLSAYKVAKDKFIKQGMKSEDAKQEAARIAKELTVNFNRKGQVATHMGALYAFFNAAMQGTARMYETLKGPAGKTILGGAFLLGTLQAITLAAAGFDEDELPEYVKNRNIVIPIGDGKYVAWPMPLGFNFLPGLSRVITEGSIAAWEGRPVNVSKRVGEISGLFLDMFNPIGNAGWSAQTIAPTVADPVVALFENKDWTGKPIAKKDFSDLDPSPGYTRAKETATWLSKELAYFLNLASGGTPDKKGLISPTPDQLDYLVGQITGGLGREVQKVSKTVESQITGEELPTYQIPLAGRFFGDISSTANVSSRFYENVTRMNEHESAIEGMRKRRENVQMYFKDNPEARLFNYSDTVYRDVSELRKQRRELVAKGAPKDRIKRVEERITRRMQQLNERIAEAEKRR